MTILQLTSHLDVGGVTRYVLSLSRKLIERGHRVIIAADHGQCEAEVRAMGAIHWPLPLHTSAEFSFPVWRARRQLAGWLQKESVDIFHAHTRVSQVIAQPLARQRRIPYVTTWHGIFKPRLGRRLWPCTGDRCIAISEPVRRHLLEDFHVPADRVRCVYNGIDVARYAVLPDAPALADFRQSLGFAPEDCVIGAIGRMASGRVKGFDLVLAAIALLRDQMPHVVLLLVGDGPRRPFLEDVAQRLEIQDCVRFVGSVNDIRLPLALMDIFVFSSRWPEGFGLSLIEAMAAGKPVVATRVGATPDIIEDGRSGLLVNPEDPAGLAGAIKQLLLRPDLAAQLGSGAQVRVQSHFSLNRMVDGIEAVYREVVNKS